MDEPKLITPLILALLAVASISFAYYERDSLPAWVQMILVFTGIIFLIFAAITAADWVMYKVAIRLELINRARSITPLTELAESLRGLTPEQAEVVRSQRLTVSVMPSVQMPIFSIVLPQGDVPRSFVREFLLSGNDIEQRPASHYSDGPKRQWANWIRDWTVAEGLAAPRGPNTPAAWVGDGRRKALYAFGVEKPEEVE